MTVYKIRGAWRDYNARMRGTETFRKVWRRGAWEWVSGPLPRASIRADDRRATVYGEVETGEIIAEFSRRNDSRADLDGFYRIGDSVEPGKPSLNKITPERPGVGRYVIDGEEMPHPIERR